MPRVFSSSSLSLVSSSLHSSTTSPVCSSTMSIGAMRLTASVRTRSSIGIWIHSTPASRSLRTAAAVNLRSLRTSTSPASSRTSRRQRWPTSRSGTTDFSYFLPSQRMRSGGVEVGEQILGRVAERLQQHGHEDLPAPVDARVDQVLVVELEVEPGAAVGDHAAGVELLARRPRPSTTWSCRRRCRASGAAGRRSPARCR